MAIIKTALVQTNPGEDKALNVERALHFIETAAARGAELVTLPEAFMFRGSNREKHWEAAEAIPGPLSEQLASCAKRLGIYLLAGSYPERPGPLDPTNDADLRTYNTSLLFGPNGRQLAKYRKIHMFDIDVPHGVSAKESARNHPGAEIVTAETEYGRMGLSICYDLRFPEVFRKQALNDAVLSFVPANFTLFTGKDHWEVLLRARAIENAMFIIAPATIGQADDFQSYGRSMIVDPWGTVIATMPDEEGVALATIDTARVRQIRQSLPSLMNRVEAAY